MAASKAVDVNVKEEPLYRTSAGRSGGNKSATGREFAKPQCTVCGLKNHSAEKCRYRFYRCQKCNEKGHLKKVCEVKKRNYHNNKLDTQLESKEPDSCDANCEECQFSNSKVCALQSYLIISNN